MWLKEEQPDDVRYVQMHGINMVGQVELRDCVYVWFRRMVPV